MNRSFFWKAVLITVCFAALLLALVYADRSGLWRHLTPYYALFTDRERIKAFISSFGLGAPAVFMLIQILQVMFAPIPGEATGFIGGYLFGTGKGFVYSSVALAAGSMINFWIGRALGKPVVRKLIPLEKLERFDAVLKRQGIVLVAILFVFPGFPKDYLCYFLGLSTLPWKVFLVIAAIGRMPGTLMLSLQGAFLFERSYGLFALIVGLSLLLAYLGYRWRERIYQWVERLNSR